MNLTDVVGSEEPPVTKFMTVLEFGGSKEAGSPESITVSLIAA